jgi:hypothetical protein
MRWRSRPLKEPTAASLFWRNVGGRSCKGRFIEPGCEDEKTAESRHALLRRAAGALCVLTMVIFGVLAGQRYLAPSESSAGDRIANQKVTSTAAGEPSEIASVEADGASSPCGSCDARHRHILRLREANP